MSKQLTHILDHLVTSAHNHNLKGDSFDRILGDIITAEAAINKYIAENYMTSQQFYDNFVKQLNYSTLRLAVDGDLTINKTIELAKIAARRAAGIEKGSA